MKIKAWTVTGAAIFAGLAIAIIQNKVVPCIGVLQNEFNIDAGTAGWLSSAFCVMGIVMAFPGAVIVEKIGLKMAGILSLVAGIIGTAIGAVSSSVGILLFSRVVEGIGAGLIAIVVPSLISEWFEAEKRGLPMSIWSTWQIVAQSLCFLVGMSVTDLFGWKGLWYGGGVIALFALVLFVLFVSLPLKPFNEEQNTNKEDKIPIIEALSGKSIKLVCVAMMFFTFSNFGFVTWIATAWSELFSINLDLANKYISVMYIFALPVSVAFGFVLNRVNHKRICVISYILYAVVATIGFLLPTKGMIIPFIIVYPFVESAVCASMWTLVPESVKSVRFVAVAMALFGLTQNVGMLIGPPISGAVMDAFGLRAVSLPVLIPGLIGALLVSMAKFEQN